MNARLNGRLPALILGAAALVAVPLLLWLNRGTTFYVDEMIWFSDLSGYNDLGSIVHPHNSHLIGTARILFFAIAELFGPDYVIVRILAAASLVLCSVLLFVWARRRVGPWLALLPSILILFYGSAWQHVVGAIGLTITLSTALGLAALLALERNDRRGDIWACVLVSAAVFTYTIGLGYLVAAAISVLLRGDRLRRAWIFLIPLALYSAWYLWARHFDEGRTSISNASHVVSYFGESMAGVSGSLSGVSIPLSRFGETTAAITDAPPGAPGWIAAGLIVLLVVVRIVRGRYSPTIWSSMGVVGTYWLAASLSTPLYFGSQPTNVRYVLPGTIGVLLIVLDACKGIRLTRAWATAVAILFVFSLAMNAVFLSDGSKFLRDSGTGVQENLAMLELGNGWLPGDGPAGGDGTTRTVLSPEIAYLGFGPDRDEYLASVGEYGSPAFDLDQVRMLPQFDRKNTDVALTQTYGLGLEPSDPPGQRADCRRQTPLSGAFELAAGGIYLRAVGEDPISLSIGRFDDLPEIPLEPAERGWSALEIPADPAPDPWIGLITSGKAEICPIAGS
jgi:hypothetical protein